MSTKKPADQTSTVWENSMKQRLTPNYDHEKLVDPTCTDLIDVFEDAWKGYILNQVKLLLENPNGNIAGMTLLCSYFESIEALHNGKSSKGQSRKFFVQGFLRVFDKSSDPATAKTVAEAIYRDVRCGVAHTGFPTCRVHIQRTHPKAFIFTYPLLPDGQRGTNAPEESIVVNASRMYDAVNRDLGRYLRTLRQPKEVKLRTHFERLMRSDWRVGQDDNIMGMTEEEFMRPAHPAGG